MQLTTVEKAVSTRIVPIVEAAFGSLVGSAAAVDQMPLLSRSSTALTFVSLANLACHAFRLLDSLMCHFNQQAEQSLGFLLILQNNQEK